MGIRELSKIYAEKHNISQTKAQNLIESVLDCVEDSLVNDGKFQRVNHLTISRVHREAHAGTHPVTHEPITIPEKTTLTISVGKGLSERLNKH